jgi:hypothetical protein
MNINFWTAIIGGIIGLITGLLIPTAKWKIDKLQQIRNDRKSFINELRATLSSKDLSHDEFIHSVQNARLRDHLSKELIEKLEVQTNSITIHVGHKRYGPEYDLLNEVNQLERKWNLI